MGRDRYDILGGSLSRGMLRFGLPISVGMGLHAVFNVVDMIIVGNLPNGAESLGVLALCDLLAMLATIVATGVANAAVAVISRKVGEGNRERACEACWRSFTLVAMAAVLFAVVALLLSHSIVVFMGAKGGVERDATRYLQVSMGGAITAFALLHITSALRAAGHSYTPTLLLMGANVLNLVLAVLLVYGPTKAPALLSWGPPLARWFHIPQLGVVGAAWATVIARGLTAVPAFLLLLKDFPVRSRADFRPTRADSRQLLAIAWPSSAQYGIRVLAILILLGVVAHVFTTASDAAALGAIGVAIRLDTFGLFLALGWGSAAATFVGQNLGAGQHGRARKAGWLAGMWNAGLLAGVGAAYILLSRDIAELFTESRAVVDICRHYLNVVGPSYAGVGLAVALSTALLGAGETLVSLKIDALALFGVQTPLILLLLVGFSLPLSACFFTIAAVNLVSAGLYAFAFSRGRWRFKEVR